MTTIELEELPELHRPRIAALIVRYLLHHITRTERKLMAAIDDLSTQVDTLQTSVTAVSDVVGQLRTQQGTPEAPIAAVGAKLQPIIDQLNALAAPVA